MPRPRPASELIRPARPQPGDPVARPQPGGPSALPMPQVRPAPRPKDIYAGKDGNVYRPRPGGGWEQSPGNKWQTVPPAPGTPRPAPSVPSTRPAPQPARPSVQPPTFSRDVQQQLSRDWTARQMGERQMVPPPQRAPSAPQPRGAPPKR